MSEEGKRDIKAKVPEWESELWSILGNGDGEHCPLYDNCPERQHGEWCVSEHMQRIEDFVESNRFDINALDFIKHTESCKVLKLVQMLTWQWWGKWGVLHPPVPKEIVTLADEERPVEIREVPLKGCHGALWGMKHSWVIQVNSNDSPLIQRFSTFHEAFHILAHRNIFTRCHVSPAFSNMQETEASFNEMLANHFAGCLILPADWVKKKWVETKDLDQMAEIFQAPKWSVCLGLKHCNIF